MVDPDAKGKVNNKTFYITAAGTEITVSKAKGADTATTRYLNFDYTQIMKMQILPNDEVLLTKVDGVLFDHPKKIHGDKGYTDRKIFPLVNTFTLYTLKTNTVINVTAWGSG